MKVNNKAHVTLNENDVKDAIIKYLYQNQGLSGIFDVKFIINIKEYYGPNITAQIIINYNEK